MRATVSCGKPLLPTLQGKGSSYFPGNRACPLSVRGSTQTGSSLRNCNAAWSTTWAGWQLLPMPADTHGHPLSGKMTPSKGDLWICKTPAGLAFNKHALRNGAKARRPRHLQDTAAARSMTGMCCILLLDTGGLCRVGNAALICPALTQPGADRIVSRSHVSAVISGRVVFARGCF